MSQPSIVVVAVAYLLLLFAIAWIVEHSSGRESDLRIFQAAWAWQINREFTFHAAGTERHQDDSVSETNGFANIMRDEDDGAPSLAPDAF